MITLLVRMHIYIQLPLRFTDTFLSKIAQDRSLSDQSVGIPLYICTSIVIDRLSSLVPLRPLLSFLSFPFLSFPLLPIIVMAGRKSDGRGKQIATPQSQLPPAHSITSPTPPLPPHTRTLRPRPISQTQPGYPTQGKRPYPGGDVASSVKYRKTGKNQKKVSIFVTSTQHY